MNASRLSSFDHQPSSFACRESTNGGVVCYNSAMPKLNSDSEPPRREPGSSSAETATRCAWAIGPHLQPYHDNEWGVPVHDEQRHFEFLVLESAQAGLSWITILKRRNAYREAFCEFDPGAVAELRPTDVERLLKDSGIIRNRRKVESAISNARAFLEVQNEFGSFDTYIWGFVDRAPIVNAWGPESQIPAETALSKELSKDMKRRGFSFLGPVVCYAHMQATGLVMDHITSCYRWRELS